MLNKEEIIAKVEKEIKIPAILPEKQKMFILMGIPGSGKSSFAEELNNIFPSVILSSDFIAIRNNLDRSEKYHWTFDILNCLVKKYLAKGYNVIVDSNSDKYRIRKNLYEIAESQGTEKVLFWIKTDLTEVNRRQKIRSEKTPGELRKEFIFHVPEWEIKKYKDDTEEPGKEENAIIINGNKNFLDQLKNFLK